MCESLRGSRLLLPSFLSLLVAVCFLTAPQISSATTTPVELDDRVTASEEDITISTLFSAFSLEPLNLDSDLVEETFILTSDNTQDIWTTSRYSYDGIFPTPGGGKDDDQLVVGGWGDHYYSLMQFDLSNLPKEVVSISLELFSKPQRGNGNTGMYLDRVNESWDWTEISTGRDNDRLWWADRPSAAQLRILSAPTERAWYSVDITNLYNDWQNGIYPNFGIQLRPTSISNHWNEFYSSHYLDDPDLRPRLVITTNQPLTLHEKAAELAKELVNQPDAYELGARGWEYYLDEYATPARIVSGYDYLSGLSGSVEHGPGIDCSGLIYWAFNKSNDPFKAHNNYVANITADGMFGDKQSNPISESELRPGDALFFDSNSDTRIDHVAMYVGESGGYDIVDAAREDLGVIGRAKDLYKTFPDFVGYRRIHGNDFEGSFKGNSPIDLIVTDPDDNTLSYDDITPSNEELIREVPGELYYSEIQQGHDRSPIDVVYVVTLKQGDYFIQVIPDNEALPTDTYSLEFNVDNTTFLLAENELISNIPSSGYGVSIGQAGAIEGFIPVEIDIKPESEANTINLGSGGNVPVAIFGSNTFDVEDIDPTSLTLANAMVKLKGNGQAIVTYTDINDDSFTDMIVHITTSAFELSEESIEANLTGLLLNGDKIKGTDFVRIVP